MGSPRKIMVIVATGAALVAFTAWGSASPGGKAVKGDSGCRCWNGAEVACCPDAGGQSPRGTILLAQRSRGADQPAASQQQAKASPASMAKGVATRKALLDQVSALMEDGVADCCIDPGCALCVIAADGCPCAGSLAKAGPVCPECWGGWQAGQGMLPDVKPEKVQILPKDQLKKLYGMKAEKLDQASK